MVDKSRQIRIFAMDPYSDMVPCKEVPQEIKVLVLKLLLSKPKSTTTAELPPEFKRRTGHELKPSKFGFLTLKEMLDKFPGVTLKGKKSQQLEIVLDKSVVRQFLRIHDPNQWEASESPPRDDDAWNTNLPYFCLEEKAPHAVCPMCNNVVKPHATTVAPCGHLYCDPCFVQMTRRSEDDHDMWNRGDDGHKGTLQCRYLSCTEKAPDESFGIRLYPLKLRTKAMSGLKRCLSRIPIVCPYFGCIWGGVLGRYVYHSAVCLHKDKPFKSEQYLTHKESGDFERKYKEVIPSVRVDIASYILKEDTEDDVLHKESTSRRTNEGRKRSYSRRSSSSSKRRSYTGPVSDRRHNAVAHRERSSEHKSRHATRRHRSRSYASSDSSDTSEHVRSKTVKSRSHSKRKKKNLADRRKRREAREGREKHKRKQRLKKREVVSSRSSSESSESSLSPKRKSKSKTRQRKRKHNTESKSVSHGRLRRTRASSTSSDSSSDSLSSSSSPSSSVSSSTYSSSLDSSSSSSTPSMSPDEDVAETSSKERRLKKGKYYDREKARRKKREKISGKVCNTVDSRISEFRSHRKRKPDSDTDLVSTPESQKNSKSINARVTAPKPTVKGESLRKQGSYEGVSRRQLHNEVENYNLVSSSSSSSSQHVHPHSSIPDVNSPAYPQYYGNMPPSGIRRRQQQHGDISHVRHDREPPSQAGFSDLPFYNHLTGGIQSRHAEPPKRQDSEPRAW